MIKRNLSEEIISVFSYIKDVICTERAGVIVNEYAYILAILNCDDSLAYKALSSIVMDITLEQMKDFYYYKITYTVNDEDNNSSQLSLFDTYITDCEEMCEKNGTQNITSSILLLSILKHHEDISNEFRDFSVTTTQLLNSVSKQTAELTTALVQIPKKHTKKQRNKVLNLSQPTQIIEKPTQINSEIDRSLTNISKLAALGKIPYVFNYDKYYDDIFTIFSKRDRNNVAVCGKSGVGKTATVKHLANIINEKKCKQHFYDKILVEMDFSKIVVGTPFKGAFEQKFYSIIDEANNNGNYIFFIDNLHMLINGSTKYAETDIETLLETLFMSPSIQVICTMTHKSFENMKKKTLFGKFLQEVLIEEPSDNDMFEILNKTKTQYEIYHDVKYTEDAIRECINLCRKYINNHALPESALDLLDLAGANESMNIQENNTVKNLKQELVSINEEIEEIKSSSITKEYDKIDELTKKQINIKTKIAIAEKEEILSKEPSKICKNKISSLVSQKVDIPLDELTMSEKNRLKELSNKIKELVIGQDEAVEEVCRAVKRQRVGLGGNERPTVLMFLGSTGTGKTYLAKQLAKEVFGNEKYFIRMDMSEYSDKTSINKINGSNPGYIGYEDETFLVKALKKQKRFVLLLDEFEKSNEEVHNIFLQMFDEGRFTDNHGEEYSIKDVIIILTSNVGASESENRGRMIGFCNNDYDFSHTIIEKELKRKFKPEFLNRIHKIVYFNKLKDEDIRSIIKLEVGKIVKKVEKLGYNLSEDIKDTIMIDNIYNSIINKKEYGARPIVNEVQRKIEDKIVDYIIENEVEEGHTFTYKELISLE